MHLSWDIALDELKALLRCTADSYKGYKEFNDKVLKKCFSELNEKTDCKFTYEPIKKGRTVKAVWFILEPLARSDDIPGQISISDFSEIMLPPYDKGKEKRDRICKGFKSEEFAEFTFSSSRAMSQERCMCLFCSRYRNKT